MKTKGGRRTRQKNSLSKLLIIFSFILAILVSAGCTGSNQENIEKEDISPAVQTTTEVPAQTEDLTINRSYVNNDLYNVSFTNTNTKNDTVTHIDFKIPTNEELTPYLYPDVSNSDYGNILSMNGNVTLNRFIDSPLPEYKLNLNMQDATANPVKFDTIEVTFSSDITQRLSLLGKAYTSYSTGQEVINSITLNPGENISFSTSSVNWANFLLNNSSTGMLALSVGIYDGNNLVGVFHARLPAVYETNGQPAEIKVGETKPLEFADYVTVGKEIDANFYRNNPHYAPKYNE